MERNTAIVLGERLGGVYHEDTITHNVEENWWTRALYELDPRYDIYCYYGGRGSGKTWGIAGALITHCVQRPTRIAVIREHERATEESSRRALEVAINRRNLAGYFNVGEKKITSTFNDSIIFFRGMSTATEEDIKGLEAVDFAWLEEANKLSRRSLEILYPTIRKPGARILISFNPKYRYDPIYVDMIAKPPPYALVQKINWAQNKFLTEFHERQRQHCLDTMPDRYSHIWLGEPDDEGAEAKVLPYSLVQKCVEAWPLRPMEAQGMPQAGFDVADSGDNFNALVSRTGPILDYAARWHSSHIGKSRRRVHAWCTQNDVKHLHYDVTSIGAGFRSHIIDAVDSGEKILYGITPINFGEGVSAPDVIYTGMIKNNQFFSKRRDQLGWGLRLRANATEKLLEGQKIDKHKCLFISPELPEECLIQFSQPVVEEDISGRMTIEKCPDGAPSPDFYDAAILAFAADSKRGLRNPV